MGTKHCKQCHSTEVIFDAWASWNEDKQEMELYEHLYHAHCLRCEGQTIVYSRELCSITSFGSIYKDVLIHAEKFRIFIDERATDEFVYIVDKVEVTPEYFNMLLENFKQQDFLVKMRENGD